jgi:hypothetical protein
VRGLPFVCFESSDKWANKTNHDWLLLLNRSNPEKHHLIQDQSDVNDPICSERPLIWNMKKKKKVIGWLLKFYATSTCFLRELKRTVDFNISPMDIYNNQKCLYQSKALIQNYESICLWLRAWITLEIPTSRPCCYLALHDHVFVLLKKKKKTKVLVLILCWLPFDFFSFNLLPCYDFWLPPAFETKNKNNIYAEILNTYIYKLEVWS